MMVIVFATVDGPVVATRRAAVLSTGLVLPGGASFLAWAGKPPVPKGMLLGDVFSMIACLNLHTNRSRRNLSIWKYS